MQLWATFSEVYINISSQIIKFLVAFFVTILVTYGILYAVDFYPETPAPEQNQGINQVPAAVSTTAPQTETDPEPVVAFPLPNKIIFDELDKEVDVLNPTSNKISDLDAALLDGTVRHPDSADFESTGNIFILGHSSYLPNVFNKNFQAFNGIQNLSWGDTIRLQSSDTEYLYRVEKVYQAKASEVTVPLDSDEPRLTLATCNSFGSKDDRYIVEAVLVDSYPLERIR